MSDISTDTEAIANRMEPWVSPAPSYSSGDVPDAEMLRVHALRLATAFRDVREKWHKAEARSNELQNITQFRHIVTFLKNAGLRLSAAWLVRRLFALTIREAIDYVDGCHVKSVCGGFCLTEDSPSTSTKQSKRVSDQTSANQDQKH